MVGREFSTLFPHNHVCACREPALEAAKLERQGSFKNVSFQLYPAEVLGIYGLMGAGRTELAEALFGLKPADSGELKVFGRRVRIKSPARAKSLGLALVPEDRRGRGLVLMHSIKNNLSLPALKYFSALGFVKRSQEKREILKVMKEFEISAEPEAAAETLSGGNQQKVVLGKWLMRPPRILILDEPTRGIDVGAKAELHAAIDRLAAQGLAILLISSELPEVLGMSDRVLVMRAGRVTGEVADPRRATQDDVMSAAAGGTNGRRNAV